ncbi:ABC transporter permease [Aurantimonas sp. A2-1-M11]|uniref:ABC transporter permease n=1 Tax=Aurantimonas sp. A2-1-M11 TaxID=3113712 RepID=UPI002F920DFC
MSDLHPLTRKLLWSIFAVVCLAMYLPMLVTALASLSRSRFFIFPVSRYSWKWYEDTFASFQIEQAAITSLIVAVIVALISVALAFAWALAYARYDWKGRKAFQILVMLPIFFPQAVLGLAVQLWLNTLGVPMSWHSTVFGQLVWIAPIASLIIAIQVFSYDPAFEDAARDLGATRWQAMRDITLPLLWPGIFAGFLFSVLLSWSNFPFAYYTSGADVTIPEWLHAKMIGGYTPMVPAVGTLSILVGAIILGGGFAMAYGVKAIAARQLRRKTA